MIYKYTLSIVKISSAGFLEYNLYLYDYVYTPNLNLNTTKIFSTMHLKFEYCQNFL